MELLNATYYNTEDLERVVRAVYATGLERDRLPATIRVQYFTPTVYGEREGRRYRRAHHWSLEGKGWGAILEAGDWPRAMLTQPNHDGDKCLSIVRMPKMLGDHDLAQLASVVDVMPEIGLRHIVFACLSFYKAERSFPGVWTDLGTSRVIRVEAKTAKSGRLRVDLKKAEQTLSDARDKCQRTGWDLVRAKKNVLHFEEELIHYQGVVDKAQEKVDGLKRKLQVD
jgi:hypothetical protein